MRERTGPKDQLTICTEMCGARCCRYVTVAIPAPRGRNDWDEVRWWLAHAGTMVTKDEDGWMLHVETRCAHLAGDNTCRVYADRMIACEEYDAESCEFTGDVPYDVCLRTEDDLADYLERRRLKRGAEVARRIRTARRAPVPPRLLPLRPLGHAAPAGATPASAAEDDGA